MDHINIYNLTPKVYFLTIDLDIEHPWPMTFKWPRPLIMSEWGGSTYRIESFCEIYDKEIHLTLTLT